jgi:hypothetical protein
MFLDFGSDAGVYFLQRSNTTISSTVKVVAKQKKMRPSKNGTAICVLNGVDEGTWWVGRVQKIRRKVDTQWGLSHQPIDLKKTSEILRRNPFLPSLSLCNDLKKSLGNSNLNMTMQIVSG